MNWSFSQLVEKTSWLFSQELRKRTGRFLNGRTGRGERWKAPLRIGYEEDGLTRVAPLEVLILKA